MVGSWKMISFPFWVFSCGTSQVAGAMPVSFRECTEISLLRSWNPKQPCPPTWPWLWGKNPTIFFTNHLLWKCGENHWFQSGDCFFYIMASPNTWLSNFWSISEQSFHSKLSWIICSCPIILPPNKDTSSTTICLGWRLNPRLAPPKEMSRRCCWWRKQ